MFWDREEDDLNFCVHWEGLHPYSDFLHQLQRRLILQIQLSQYILVWTDEYNLKRFMGSDFFLIKGALCFTVTLKVLFIITFFRSLLGR
ncbi:unnamed protein product [Bubo scandiacus]